MNEVVLIEGPVMKVGGELAVFIFIGEEGPYSERLKVVISDRLAGTSQIEVGDLICLQNTEGRFKLQPVKVRSLS